MDEATIRYWRKFEEETGEKAEARAMGQWESREGREALWGLLILGERSLRFRSFPGESWMERLFAAKPRGEGREEKLEIVIPLDAVLGFREPPRGFWKRLFGPSRLLFSLEWREGEGLRRESFSADTPRFIEALGRALETRGAARSTEGPERA